jgi:hypothetical protein
MEVLDKLKIHLNSKIKLNILLRICRNCLIKIKLIRVYSQLGYKKGMTYISKTKKDNFDFLFIIHYYKCDGFLYAYR